MGEPDAPFSFVPKGGKTGIVVQKRGKRHKKRRKREEMRQERYGEQNDLRTKVFLVEKGHL